MPLQRPKYPKKDKNHRELVLSCQSYGIVVWDLSQLGGKVGDTIMFYGGKCLPVEIKDVGKRDELTDGEKEGIAECAAVGVDWVIAETVEDVLRAFGMTEEM